MGSTKVVTEIQGSGEGNGMGSRIMRTFEKKMFFLRDIVRSLQVGNVRLNKVYASSATYTLKF
jgi:hypothetical protein